MVRVIVHASRDKGPRGSICVIMYTFFVLMFIFDAVEPRSSERVIGSELVNYFQPNMDWDIDSFTFVRSS